MPAGVEPASGVPGPLDPAWRPLDEQYAAWLDAHPEPPGGSLLAQTILTGPARRRVLAHVPPRDGTDVLDVGTGFGPLLFEAAHLAAVRAVGVDQDRAVLDVAREIAGNLEAWIRPGTTVELIDGDVLALPFPAACFDVCTARLLFQHLEQPRRAIDELARVLRRGGEIQIFDVDDGLSITYPPASDALVALESAFSASQVQRGGDREVGRKLSSYLVDAGFSISAIHPIAQARHLATAAGDGVRTVNTQRFENVRGAILAGGFMDVAEFDACLASYRNEPAVGRFRSETQLLVVATKQ